MTCHSKSAINPAPNPAPQDVIDDIDDDEVQQRLVTGADSDIINLYDMCVVLSLWEKEWMMNLI
jgi:hypothetical protein